MTSNNSIVPLRQRDTIDDPLTAILRSGARRLLAQAIEAEADAFLAEMKGLRLPDGRERVVRHGHGPERLIQTSVSATVAKARSSRLGLGHPTLRSSATILRHSAAHPSSPVSLSAHLTMTSRVPSGRPSGNARRTA